MGDPGLTGEVPELHVLPRRRLVLSGHVSLLRMVPEVEMSSEGLLVRGQRAMGPMGWLG